ncbi:SDR family oxidoreductase [Actinomadura sp. WMMB 499]|uniref:SDR family oxidoreductase n=1 Tax=Actinomadura sp. WMMB 499 TaxID=1219491 RepID=UPI0012465FAF|nr:SDR family oxidoreductase [Actinomadura sp. WMMB 499]QFG23706.1 SDR family oxidoreductase [Actinomadura sp. WMMB 499]
MKIVVVGGTGLIGSKVVAWLGEHGHDAVAAAPSTGVDTLTGEGLDGALAGASVVVDVSNSPTFEDEAVLRFFETSTGNLLGAERRAGVGHHVALSVVGTGDRPDVGYFRAKLAQERLIRESGVPWSIVHATQFFEFVPRIADGAADGERVRIPPVRFRPIAGGEVARTVARVAAGEPLNAAIEIAGPRQYRMDEFFREALAALGDPREVVTDPDARYFGAVMRDGDLVPGDGAALGEIDYADWLKAGPTV